MCMRIYLVDHDRLAANRYRHWDERISLFSWENKLASQPSAPAATVDHVHWIKSDCENKLSCENKLNCETEVDNPSRSTTFGIMARDYIPSISSSLMTLLPCACLFSWENKLWVCSLKRTNSLKITLCNYFRVRLLSDTLKKTASPYFPESLYITHLLPNHWDRAAGKTAGSVSHVFWGCLGMLRVVFHTRRITK